MRRRPHEGAITSRRAGLFRTHTAAKFLDVLFPHRTNGNPDAVEPDPAVQEEVVNPVVEAIAALDATVIGMSEVALDATVIGMSEVALDGQRNAVRTHETNLGNLIADALLAQAQALADDFGAPQPDVALQNGGGIRNDTIIAAGDLTELDI